MNLKKTLLLGAVVAAGLIYAYQVEVPAGERKAKEQQLFAYLPEEGFEKLSFTRKGESFALVNAAPADPNIKDKADPAKKKDLGADWSVEGIPNSIVDTPVISSLFSAFDGLRTGTPLAKEDLDADLSIYGLKDPDLSVTVKGRALEGGPSTIALHFGKMNEYVHQRYARIERSGGEYSDSNVFLIPDNLYSAANKSSFDFRKKTPVEFVDGDVKSFSFQRLPAASGESSTTIALKTDPPKASGGLIVGSHWTVTDPSSPGRTFGAADDKVGEVLRNLRSIRAASFVDGDEAKNLAKYGLDTGIGSTKVEFSDQSKHAPLELLFGSVEVEKDKKREFYLKSSAAPSLFRLELDPTQNIFRGVDELREKKFFRFPSEDLTGVELVAEDKRVLVLSRSKPSTQGEATWQVSENGGTSAQGDQVFIRDLLTRLSQLSASGFPPAGEDLGFSSPSSKVTITASDGDKTRKAVLLFGKRVAPAVAVNPPKDKAEATLVAAGVLDGEQSQVELPFLVLASELEKFFPKKEQLVPVPTPGAAAEGASQDSVSSIAEAK